MNGLDYLTIGHLTIDLTPDGRQTGGTVTFASQTARALGCRVAALTSAVAGQDLHALDGVEVELIPAPETTTFANVYRAGSRQQTIHGRAEAIEARHLPESWRRAAIVHLAPVANEVDPAIIELFSNSLVGITPQGWLRAWDQNGHVHGREWPEAEQVARRAGAVILSEHDVLGSAMLDCFQQSAPLLVLTQGAAGCTVFFRGESRHFPAPPVTEVEATGAGDVFAAAYLFRLHQTAGNPWEAARFANLLAAQSVTAATLAGKMAAVRRILDLGGRQ
jgi:sugar/nucleoside kinase (ribokinase family)